MRRLLPLLLFVYLIAASACRKAPAPQADGGAEAPPSESPANEQQLSDPDTTLTDNEDKALVQILFAGSMVFQRQLVDGKLDKILVYLPDLEPSHTISAAFGGKPEGSNKWIDFEEDLDNKTITFKTGSEEALEAPEPANLSVRPDTEEKASDSRWLQLESQIGAASGPVISTAAMLTVELDAGTFLTCGLVHNVDGHPCHVDIGDADPRPATAEYMVLRLVTKKDESISMLIDDGQGTVHEVSVKENPNSNVEGFGKVYDIAIFNLVDGDSRVLTSDHAELLKVLFETPAGTWKPAVASNCSDTAQPACFTRYREFDGNQGGFNRPICPLLEADPVVAAPSPPDDDSPPDGGSMSEDS